MIVLSANKYTLTGEEVTAFWHYEARLGTGCHASVAAADVKRYWPDLSDDFVLWLQRLPALETLDVTHSLEEA